MRNDVKNFIKRCPTCLRNKIGPRHGSSHCPPNGSRPWEVVSIDIVDLEAKSGKRKAVIFIDRFSPCPSLRG